MGQQIKYFAQGLHKGDLNSCELCMPVIHLEMTFEDELKFVKNT